MADTPAAGTPGALDALRWTITLDLASLAAIEDDVRRFLVDAGVDGRAAFTAQLVVEEIVRNLVEHTPPYAAHETAEVRIAVGPATVTVVIEDARPPFSPFDGPALDVTAPLEDRRAGGMGLHLVRELTDELTYERAGERNRLVAVIGRAS
jgi:anti-sigma regulatory factor (Ser/Thr protein kinase)